MSNDKIEAVKGVSSTSSKQMEMRAKTDVAIKISDFMERKVPIEKIATASIKMFKDMGFTEQDSKKMTLDVLQTNFHLDDGTLAKLREAESGGSSNSNNGNNNSGSSADANAIYADSRINSNIQSMDLPINLVFTGKKMQVMGIKGGPAFEVMKELDKKAKSGDKESAKELQTWKSAVANTDVQKMKLIGDDWS